MIESLAIFGAGLIVGVVIGVAAFRWALNRINVE